MGNSALYSIAFVSGFAIYFLVYKKAKAKLPFDIKKQERFLSTGNLLFIVGAYAVSIWAIYLASGTMKPPDLQMIYDFALAFSILTALLFGIFIARAVDLIWDAWQRAKREKRDNQVRAIAYHLWEENGKQVGHDLEYWIKAEKLYRDKKKQ